MGMLSLRSLPTAATLQPLSAALVAPGVVFSELGNGATALPPAAALVLTGGFGALLLAATAGVIGAIAGGCVTSEPHELGANTMMSPCTGVMLCTIPELSAAAHCV